MDGPPVIVEYDVPTTSKKSKGKSAPVRSKTSKGFFDVALFSFIHSSVLLMSY